MQTNSTSLLKAFSDEKVLLEKMRKDAVSRKIPIIDESVGRLLETLCLAQNPKKILEIGCGIGFSTYFILKNLKETKYVGIDLNLSRIKEARTFIQGMFDKIETDFIHGNALEVLPGIIGSFDLIFIDAAKHEYPQYLDVLAGKMMIGTIVIADNVLYKCKVFEKRIPKRDENSVGGIKRYLEMISEEQGYDSIILDIGDGISLSIKRS
jgi:predicted O-methyltransferase YrrM